MIISGLYDSNLSPKDFLSGVLEVGGKSSGQNVTAESAKNVSTAYRCINILSDDIAKLPFQTYRVAGPGKIERVKPSVIFQNVPYLLEYSPNRYMVPFIFKKMAVNWLLTHGAAYIWLPIPPDGLRREMFVIPSDRVRPLFDEFGGLWYEVDMPGKEKKYIPDVEMWVWLINSIDGVSGRGVIHYARDTIGRQLAGYQAQDQLYSQGLTAAGIAYVNGELNDEAREKVRKSYEMVMSGEANRGRLAVFDNLVTKFEKIAFSPVDVQFLESLTGGDKQIANFFGLPEYKLNLGKQSYQSNEQNNLDYLNTTLDPYFVQMEQSAAIKLLKLNEIESYYLRINRDALLRTDARSRAELLYKKIGSGQLSPNEARQIDDLSDYENGDRRYIPSNWSVIE